MSETSFTKEWTVLRRSEIKRENSVTISPLVEQINFIYGVKIQMKHF